MVSRTPEGAGKAPEALFAIVLAAGASTRFGSPKQLVRIAGRPLLHTAEFCAAHAITIAGDFNGWKPETAIPMRKQPNGEWAATIQLPAGRHLYKLIVDGKWIPDPENPAQEDDNYGGKNSVVVVGK